MDADADPFVWPDVLDPDAVREIRAMKARTEEMTRAQGPGRPRAQARARRHPRHRVRGAAAAARARPRTTSRSVAATTLDALEQLADGGYVDRADATQLDDAYVFLRTVEHRLQLVDEHQTHTLPTDDAARTRLARVLGYRDRRDARRSSASRPTTARTSAIVRTIHETPLLRAAARHARRRRAAVDGSGRGAARRLRLPDVERTRAASASSPPASPAARGSCSSCCPSILEWLSDTPDPDLGLLQLRRLAEGYDALGDAGAVASATRPLAAERDVPPARVEPRARRRAAPPARVRRRARRRRRARERDGPRRARRRRARHARLARRRRPQRRAGLRRFKRRELLRIGARDLLGFAPVEIDGRELAAPRGRVRRGRAGESLEPSLPFAVIGMGRLGGAELSYASDIDVLFVYDGDDRRRLRRRRAARRRRWSPRSAQTTAEGQTFRIDTRLRPEGNQGPLARSLGGYRDVLRAVGAHVGAPGAHQGPRRRRRRRRSARASASSLDDVVYARPFTDE